MASTTTIKTLGEQFQSGCATYVPAGKLSEVNANSSSTNLHQKFHPCLLALDATTRETITRRLPVFVGATKIGADVEDEGQDIFIKGDGILPTHCVLNNDGNCVTLTPFNRAKSCANGDDPNANGDDDDDTNANDNDDPICFIDGVRTTTTTKLAQGNVILLGTCNYFKFHDFFEAGLHNDGVAPLLNGFVDEPRRSSFPNGVAVNGASPFRPAPGPKPATAPKPKMIRAEAPSTPPTPDGQHRPSPLPVPKTTLPKPSVPAKPSPVNAKARLSSGDSTSTTPSSTPRSSASSSATPRASVDLREPNGVVTVASIASSTPSIVEASAGGAVFLETVASSVSASMPDVSSKELGEDSIETSATDEKTDSMSPKTPTLMNDETSTTSTTTTSLSATATPSAQRSALPPQRTSSLSQTLSKLALQPSPVSPNSSASSSSAKPRDLSSPPPNASSPTPSSASNYRLSSNSFLGEKLLFSNSSSRHSFGSRTSISPTPNDQPESSEESATHVLPPPVPPHRETAGSPIALAADFAAAHPDAVLTEEFMIDGRHITYYEDDDASNLGEEQLQLLRKHREIVEARKKEQEAQKAEVERLDEILRICEEYAKQNVGMSASMMGSLGTSSSGIPKAEETVKAATTDDIKVEKSSHLKSSFGVGSQSPPPLSKLGRKAYGLGSSSNSPNEATKETLIAGAVSSSSNFGGSLDGEAAFRSSPPKSPILDGSNYCSSPAFQRGIKTNGSLSRMKQRKDSKQGSLHSLSSEDSLEGVVDDDDKSEAASKAESKEENVFEEESAAMKESMPTPPERNETPNAILANSDTSPAKPKDDGVDDDYDDPPAVDVEEPKTLKKIKTNPEANQVTCVAEIHVSADVEENLTSEENGGSGAGLGVLTETVHDGVTLISFTFAEKASPAEADPNAAAETDARSLDASSAERGEGSLWQKEESHDSGLRLSGSSSSSSDKLLSVPSNDLKDQGTQVSPNRTPDNAASSPSKTPSTDLTPLTGKAGAEHKIIVKRMSEIKAKVVDLEQQQTEVIREMELERALLEGEHRTEREALYEEETALVALRRREKELLEKAAEAKRVQANHLRAEKQKIEGIEQKLEFVERELAKLGDSAERQGLEAQCKAINEVLDSERKVFEDMEFQQLELESKYEEEKEEIQRQLQQEQRSLEETRREREQRLREIDDQQREMLLQCKRDTETLEVRRERLVAEFQLEKEKLKEIEKFGKFKTPLENSSPKSRHGDDDAQDPTRLSQSSDSDNSMLDDTSRPPPTTPSPISTGGCNSGYNTLRSSSQMEKRKILELKKKAIEEQLTALRNKGFDVSISLRDSPLRESGRRPVTDQNGLTSDEYSESDKDTSNCSTDGFGDLPGADQLSPQLKRILSTQLLQREEERRKREDLEQRLAEETRRRESMEVQLRQKKSAAAQARPLTRYLPVRGKGDDFNLRAHIDLAGHHVDLCPDVEIGAYSCRGFLHKLGSKFKVWNKRWFVLDRHKRSLSYYTDKSETKPRGGIYFQSIQETYPDHLQTVKSPNPKLTFVVKTLDRLYFFYAPSPEAMRIWVDVIFTGAEAYEAYMS